MTRPIKSIIIHSSATPNGKWIDVIDIDSWHRERGLKRSPEFRQWQNPELTSIGYHFVIYANGAVATGRDLDEAGNHVKGFNNKTVGICLIGADKFTAAQWRSLRENVCRLQEHFMLLQGDKEPVRVLGHRDLLSVFSENNCPGFSVADWLANNMRPLPGLVLDESGIADDE